MPSITSLFQALGNERAVRNAATALDARRREEWLVAGLVQRLDRCEGTSQATGGGSSGASTPVAV